MHFGGVTGWVIWYALLVIGIARGKTCGGSMDNIRRWSTVDARGVTNLLSAPVDMKGGWALKHAAAFSAAGKTR